MEVQAEQPAHHRDARSRCRGLLRKNQVRQLVRGDGGRIIVQEPDEDPMNLGIAGVLLSDLYGFPSLMAPEIADKIHRKHRLVAKGETRMPSEDEDLEKLRRELTEIDLSAIHPDSLYARFLKRLFQRERDDLLAKPAFSPAELRELEELTNEVFEELQLGDERPAAERIDIGGLGIAEDWKERAERARELSPLPLQRIGPR